METEAAVGGPHGARRPTIRDVARLAGVSHQTVSRYLRYEGGLKSATLARIDDAIRALNYRPNLVARSLVTRRTGQLAVVMPPMAYSPARLLSGATSAAHSAGYSINIHSPEGGAQARTELLLNLAESGQVEGILSFAPVLPEIEHQLPAGAAVVISSDFDDKMRGIGEMADASPVVEVIERLATLGHRRFLHVSGDLNFASARARKQTYLDTVHRLGLESVGVLGGEWSGECGIEAARSLPAEGAPTAVIAANDLIASGVVRGALERGWLVPRDLSVTGWDNIGVGQFLSPSLTTVDVNLERLGHDAMSRLIAAVRHEEFLNARIPLNRVIWRESTAAPGTPSV